MKALKDHRTACVRALAERIAAETPFVSAEDILGRKRTPSVMRARHRMYAELWMEGLSIAEVARLLDREHATIIHGLRKTVGPAEYQLENERRFGRKTS
jgi:chromosomal replication initiation ATPase DnaA